MAFQIGLPCEVHRIRARMAPSSHLTSLEEHALRAIRAFEKDRGQHGKGCGVADLELLFGLPPRLTFDLVQDLWRANYVRVNLETSAIVLAPQVAALIDQPERLRELETGRVEDVEFEVALDVVTGAVLTVGETVRGLAESPTAPRPTSPWTLAEIPSATLVRAVVEQEERDARGGGASRWGTGGRERAPRACLGVARRLGGPTATRYRPVDITVAEVDEGRYLAHVARDQGLTRDERTRIEAFLAERLQEPPNTGFRDRLVGAVSRSYDAPPPLADELARLREMAESLADADPGTWAERQAQLERRATHVRDELDLADRLTAGLRLVRAPDDHVMQLKRLLADAEHQVVLIGPWLRERTINGTLAGALQDAMRRGVRVVVGWGIKHGEELEPRIRRELEMMRREVAPSDPHRLLVAPHSLVTHAKVAVADCREVLVTSFNFLSSPGEHEELGVLATQGGGGVLAERVVDWVTSVWPDYPESRTLRPVGCGVALEASEGRIPPVPDPAGGGGRASQQLWARQWSGVASELAQRAALLPDRVVDVVTDAQHRALMDSALRTVEHRLLITSDQLAPRACTPTFLHAVRDRLEAGVHVVLLTGRDAERSTDDARAALLAELERLASESEGRFRHVRHPGWHAKVLVADGTALVGSFNYLSYEGDYATSARHRRSEVSLRLAGPIVDQVCEEVASIAGLPPLPPLPAPLGPAEELGDGTEQTWPIRSMLEATPGALSSTAADALEHLSAAELVAALEALPGLGERQEPLLAAVALHCPGDAGTPVRDRLAAHWWEQGRFALVAALRAGAGDGKKDPDGWLAALAVVRSTPALGAWLKEADVASRSRDDRRTLGAVLAVEALAPVDEQAQEAATVFLFSHAEDLDLGPCATFAVEHLNVHEPLPAGRVAQLETILQADANLENLWGELDQRIETWSHSTPPGQLGVQLRARLAAADSPRSELARVAQQRNLPALRDWLARWASAPRVHEAADELLREVEERAHEHIRSHGRRRTEHLTRIIGPVIDAARDLSSQQEPDTELTHMGSVLREALRAFPDLQVDGRAHQVLLQVALRRFDPLRAEDR